MAGVHQQPEQSNFLAEGQIQTCKLVVTASEKSQKTENYADGRAPPASIKERETQWSEVPYAKHPPETGKSLRNFHQASSFMQVAGKLHAHLLQYSCNCSRENFCNQSSSRPGVGYC